MYYEIIGKENVKTVVLLHGWGADSSVFRGVVSLFPKNSWRYLLIDFAGFGKSPEPDIPYSVGDYAEEVAELLKTLEIKSAIFIGHSFGGRVSIALASRHSELVEKLVLVDSAGLIMNRGIRYKIRVWKYKIKKFCVKKGILKGDLKSAGSADYKSLNSDIMRQTFVKVVNEDLLKDAKKITARTVLVWGSLDKDTPIKMARKFKRSITNSVLYVLDGAGHYSFLDKTEDFVYILYDNIFI